MSNFHQESYHSGLFWVRNDQKRIASQMSELLDKFVCRATRDDMLIGGIVYRHGPDLFCHGALDYETRVIPGPFEVHNSLS